jgi:hypothetical protein
MMDIEVPARHRHFLEIETVLFSAFYPPGMGPDKGEEG